MRLAACLVLAALTAAAATPRRVLLLGNSAYQHLPPLPTPKSNVEALKSALLQLNFSPQVASDLAQAAMLDTLRSFVATVQPGDFVLIYFSGYGYQDAASGLNYLLPADFDARDRTALNSKALSIRLIEGLLEERKAGTKLLLFDACRPAPGLPVGLAGISPHRNTAVSFSAAENQTVLDPPDGGVNLYTAALIHALETPGSTPANLATRAFAQVQADSQGKQLPFVMIQAPDEEMVFAPFPAAAPKPPAGATAPPPNRQPTARKTGDTKINPQDGLTYVWIQPGKFQMGCSAGDDACGDDEKPAHEVIISKGFWIGQTEVTQEAYERVVGKNPSHDPGAHHPVGSVTWAAARGYCVSVGMHLPTEAEWEFAARAGSAGRRYGELNLIAWFAGNSRNSTHDVGGKQPNAWGLYDTLGNVWEWVSDFFAPYTAESATDPRGPAAGQFHVRRGGALGSLQGLVRVSARGGNSGAVVGVRCAGN